MAERSKTLDSGSREPGSIPVSGLLVCLFRTAHAEKYTHGQFTQPLMWLSVHQEEAAPLGVMCQRVKRKKYAHAVRELHAGSFAGSN